MRAETSCNEKPWFYIHLIIDWKHYGIFYIGYFIVLYYNISLYVRMPYHKIEIDVHVQTHWERFLQELLHHHHHLKHQLENPIIEHVWADRIHHHEVLYQFHIKTGHFPHHHHFTILCDVKHDHFKIVNVQEGHQTLFWSSITDLSYTILPNKLIDQERCAMIYKI